MENKKINEKLIELGAKGYLAKEKIINRVKNTMNNDRGGEILAGIVFAAIIIIGVVAMKTDTVDGFKGVAGKFKTWIVSRVTTILDSDTSHFN